MNHRHKFGWGIFNLLLIVAIGLGGWWVYFHHQDIVDWWRLQHYTPSAAVAQLANDDTMVGQGRNMFYASNPQIEDRSAFNANCGASLNEQGSVLGCYTRQNIYIFDVNDPRLPGVQQVTAAHETLHAAYERLDGATKARVDTLLQAELDKRTNDTDLQQAIALYNKTEPGELLNEMHSILGTEYSVLSPELEQYYQQYFSNRAKIVAYAKTYKSVFSASRARITMYQSRLDTLKQQIDSNTSQLNERIGEITTQSAQLEALRSSDPKTYNQQVPGFNAKVVAYNQLAATTQNLINQYNAIVVQYKNEIALQTDLTHSLDSKYQPVPTQ